MVGKGVALQSENMVIGPVMVGSSVAGESKQMHSADGSPRSEFRYFTVLAGVFVASLLLSNTVAVKLFQLGALVLTGGVIVFPICYILGDVLTEVYGYARTRRVIWIGFVAQLIMIAVYSIVIALPPASFWPHQDAIVAVLGPVPRIVLASLIGYLAGGFLNSFVLAKMKVWTAGRLLWARTIGSTIVGQGADSFLFVFIAFGGVYPGPELIVTALSIFAFKTAFEILITPATYVIVGGLKKREKVDFYDRETDFAPLRW